MVEVDLVVFVISVLLAACRVGEREAEAWWTCYLSVQG